jgi:hypothetical protein
MRPQGQPKSDGALPDSSDKSGERVSKTGQRWGDADLRPPTGERRAPREPKTKLALGAPPPPAGVPLELPADEVDAVAGLFATDRTVPAPGINDAPSEAELGRWVATAQNSMFDDRVKDPAPVAMAPPAPTGRASEPQRRPSAPKLPAIADDVDDEAPLGMREPEAVPSRKPRAPAPPPPASPLPVQAKRTGSGARKKSAPAQPKPAEPEGQDEELQLKPRKRRIERGPSKTLLISVGVAALLSLGAATVLIGVVPNPFAPEPPAPSAAPARRAKPAPAKVAAAKPAPAVTAAPTKTPASAAAVHATTKSAPPKVAATPVLAPAAAQAKPAVAAPTPAPAKPVAVTVAVAAKPEVAQPVAKAPAAPAPANEESDGEDSSSGGSGKLSQARKLLAADNPKGAEALALQVLAGDPQDHHAMDVLAHALMDQDRGKEALPYARKMVQKRAKRVPYRLLLGDLLLMVGDEAGARAQWQNALELAPNDREIKRRLGK